MRLKTHNPTVFLTGASGLLGSAILRYLPKEWPLLGVFRSHPIQHPGRECFALDLADSNETHRVLDNFKPEVIIHTAALTNVDECEADRKNAYACNVTATENLAHYCQKTGAKLVHISTDAFFKGEKSLFSEEDTPTPLNYYGETKYLAEQNLQKLCSNNVIVRTNLYGWNYQKKESLAEWMLSSLKNKKKLLLFRDVFYTPILTRSLTMAIKEMILADVTGIYHVAGTRKLSKLEFGQKLCEVFELDPQSIDPISIDDLPFKAPRSKNMALATTKFQKQFPSILGSIEKDLIDFKNTSALQGQR